MSDNLATLKAAEAAGATIQAYTIYPSEKAASPYYNRDAQMPLAALPMGSGYWRDLEGPVQWSCDPSRYRIKPGDELTFAAPEYIPFQFAGPDAAMNFKDGVLPEVGDEIRLVCYARDEKGVKAHWVAVKVEGEA